jgi:hypothetical protein
MSRARDTIVVASRFRGPPGMGNGGYACGVIARHIAGTAQVRLQSPVPLDRPLVVTRHSDGVTVTDGATHIAEARPADLELDVPAPPSYAEAENAAAAYVGFHDHAAPTCFVCGPERQPHDGLRIFSGPVAGRDLVAAPWIPDPTLADASNPVAAEFVWGAIDCPGAWACHYGKERVLLLGQLTAAIARRPAVGERCVVIGWQIAQQGRKHFAGSALFSENGTLCARGSAVWIEVSSS